MKEIIFKGTGTAIATPFDSKDNINFDEFKKLVEFQIENGVNAIIVCGTTGEAATLSQEEKQELIKYCTKIVNKRIPVIAGIGSNNTKAVIENEKYAEKIGVDGLLAVTPYYNKTTQEGLIAHYKIIASNTSLPIILYNVPSRTGVNILPETYYKLSKIKNIVAAKEANGDLSSAIKTKALCKDNLHIYSGNDDQILPMLSIGGIGVISVLSNIMPKYTSDITKKFFDGDMKKAEKMQLNSIKLINSLFKEVNPIPIKEALNILGYNFGKPRLPLVPCSKELSEDLRKELKKLKILK